MIFMYSVGLAFLILNNISFYFMEYVTDRAEGTTKNLLTPNELWFYVFLRLITKVTLIILCTLISINFINMFF